MVEKDFIGFTFDNVHSDDLGIVRVSNGDRYTEDLHPELQDLTAEVPGMDGEYYFGSKYGTKKFEIDIAYDSLTETQFRKLRQLFSDKEVHELIFDERPYKKYLVKLESPIELSYVCFAEEKKVETAFNGINGPTTVLRPNGQIERIYKGDGTISLIAYFPFAKSVFKTIPTDEYNDLEWASSSGILTAQDYELNLVDSPVKEADNVVIKLYNAGDMKTDFRLYCPNPNFQTETITEENLVINYIPYPGREVTGTLTIEGLKIDNNDMGIIINTSNNLIEGVVDYSVGENISYRTSGNIYNNYITNGNFFKIEINNTPNEATLTATGSLATEYLDIYYDYLYF